MGFEWTPVVDRDVIRCRNLEQVASLLLVIVLQCGAVWCNVVQCGAL